MGRLNCYIAAFIFVTCRTRFKPSRLSASSFHFIIALEILHWHVFTATFGKTVQLLSYL